LLLSAGGSHQGGMFDLSSLHGVTLTIKHGIFLVMIVVGLFISLGVAPKLKSLAPAPGEKPSNQLLAVQRRLDTLSDINLVLGMLVLACVAVMQS
jgi:putative copper export protein